MEGDDCDMTEYEQICEFTNLYKSHLQCRKGKRKKNEVVRYEMRLAEKLTILSDQLKRKEYEMQGYYHFVIKEPKTRAIYAAYYMDRVLIRTICDLVIEPTLGPRLIYDNAACQKGKGTHFALNRFEGFIRKCYKQHGTQVYILKCDITKYFPSIDHEILKSKLRKVIKDKDIMKLMEQYVDKFHSEGTPGKGIALGNQSSQWYAIYYLDSLDRYVKEQLRVKYYLRYMDDFLIIHHDKEYLKECKNLIEKYLMDELELTLNPKTEIVKAISGVEFLGWKFYLFESGKIIRRIKRQSKLRVKRGVKKLGVRYQNREIDLAKVEQVMASYNGHLQHGDTYIFRDRLLKDLAYACNKSE